MLVWERGGTGGFLGGTGQASTPTQEAPNSVSTSIWQSLGAFQLPVWTQLGYKDSSPNLTDGLESPSCLYGTLMKTGTLCPEAWASLGRHGGQRAAQRPSRSETGWDPSSAQELCQAKQSGVCQETQRSRSRRPPGNKGFHASHKVKPTQRDGCQAAPQPATQAVPRGVAGARGSAACPHCTSWGLAGPCWGARTC